MGEAFLLYSFLHFSTSEDLVNIKYSKKKEELRKDPVIETALATKAYIQENSNTILVFLAIIVFVGGGFLFYSYNTKKNRQNAQEGYGKAMIEFQNGNISDAVSSFSLVVDNYKNTPQAVYSAYILGNIHLIQGNYDEAINWFETVASKGKDAAFIQGKAFEELAACFEEKGDLDQSLKYLERALNDKRVAFRHPPIRWKMALIYKELDRNDEAQKYCRELMSDTLAGEYMQKAENLLLEIQSL